MKWRCMLGDRFIDVEADSEVAAQEQAFARTVRDLTPADFIAWETGPTDEWRATP
jgi:hypothetical protein